MAAGQDDVEFLASVEKQLPGPVFENAFVSKVLIYLYVSLPVYIYRISTIVLSNTRETRRGTVCKATPRGTAGRATLSLQPCLAHRYGGHLCDLKRNALMCARVLSVYRALSAGNLHSLLRNHCIAGMSSVSVCVNIQNSTVHTCIPLSL